MYCHFNYYNSKNTSKNIKVLQDISFTSLSYELQTFLQYLWKRNKECPSLGRVESSHTCLALP